MKSKAPLVMMEQIVMILVFALAAALCLQAFVLSDRLSVEARQRDMAVVLCQNMVESEKFAAKTDGPLVDKKYPTGEGTYYFDDEGKPSFEPSFYTVELTRLPERLPYLGESRVTVTNPEGKELYSLEFSWQKQTKDYY